MEYGESVQIERLTRRKKGRPGEEIEVLLSDASSFFAALTVWQDQPFHEGDELTPADIQRICERSSIIATRARALSLLARSDHSAFLLKQKLVSRGHALPAVTAVLDGLAQNGTLDDGRYARSWTRDRLRRHPEGVSILVAGLRQRGVSSQVAQEAVSDVLSEDDIDPAERVQRLAERLMRNRGATPATVAAKLLRRGFSSSLVRRVTAELTGQDMEEPE